MCTKFLYSEEDFNFISKPDDQSVMDTSLKTIWERKVNDGCFRYELGDLKTKCPPGKYNFVVQLNTKRAIERRKPQLVTDVLMMFDPANFHFGKVTEKEVLFTIRPRHWEKTEIDRNVLLINVSPLEYCHSLLVPSIDMCLPQVLNFNALRLGVELMLTSRDSYFRIGFNSLGGFASVNHLHLHAYYLKYRLFLEHAPVIQLKGSCYELINFPAEGFVFEVLKKEDILETTRSVLILIDFLNQKKFAHNVFLTRAMPIPGVNRKVDELCSLRIYVWGREPCFGVKDERSFNIAVCELAGHISMKDEKAFEEVTEEAIATRLHNVCHETFLTVKDNIKRMY